jgi:hypothetical protein
MAELKKYRSFVLTYNPTTQTFQVGANALVRVFNEGASVNQTGALSGAAGTVLTTFSAGSFVGNSTMYAQIGLSGQPRLVTGASATTLTLGANPAGAGVSQTVAIGDRVLNIGTASDKSAPGSVIYAVDQTTATPITSSLLTCDGNGNFQFYAPSGDYDILAQTSAGVDLFIDPDITLGPITSASGVVALANVLDDFSVGGATLAASAFFVDESAETVYVGGSTAPYVQLLGAGTVALATASGNPLMQWVNASATGTLTSAHTATKTWTLPDVSGTLLVGATQTVAGTQTFSGAVIMSSTLAVTGAVTASALITGALGATITGAPTSVTRLKSDQGTAIPSNGVGVIALSAGWGTTASVAVDSGSRDQRMSFTVTSAGTGQGASPTITITFTNGTWTNPPFVSVTRGGSAAGGFGTLGATSLSWSVTATAIVITSTLQPTATNTLPLTVLVWG